MKQIDLLEILQAGVAIVFSVIPQKKPSARQLQNVKIIAHRGNGVWNGKRSVENTLEAINQCITHSVWGIECDLRWTKDNVPVISHDNCTLRVFHAPLDISKTSFYDLREKFPLVPSLAEVVEVIKNKTHLMLELKESLTPEQLIILQNKLSILDSEKDFHLMSLKPVVFESCKGFSKKTFVSIGEISTAKILNETLSESWGGYTGHFLLTRKPMILMCKTRGISVGTGFVDSKNTLYREAHRGINWVFTDHPERILEYI